MKKSTASGFSLIELVFSMAVIGVLMSLLIPHFGNIRDKALETSVKAVALSVQTGIESYASEYQSYPDGSSGIASLAALLIDEGMLTATPKNPYTQDTYSDTDASGRIVYEASSDGMGYTITAYKRDGQTAILTVTGGTQQS